MSDERLRRPLIRPATLVILLLTLVGRVHGYETIELAAAGSVAGRVVFTGDIPTLPPTLVLKDEESCAAATAPQGLRVSVENRGVMNTVVSLEGINRGKAPPSQKPILDNKECVLTPRVLAVMVGSEVVIQSSDPFLHTTRGRLPNLKQAFNLVFPKHTAPKEQKIRFPGLITVTCDTHPHMKAYIHSFEHPYSVVTDERGHFEIAQVPPGEYTLKAWHEGWAIIGYDEGGRPLHEEPHEMATRITVTAGEVGYVEFQLSARD